MIDHAVTLQVVRILMLLILMLKHVSMMVAVFYQFLDVQTQRQLILTQMPILILPMEVLLIIHFQLEGTLTVINILFLIPLKIV